MYFFPLLVDLSSFIQVQKRQIYEEMNIYSGNDEEIGKRDKWLREVWCGPIWWLLGSTQPIGRTVDTPPAPLSVYPPKPVWFTHFYNDFDVSQMLPWMPLQMR